MSDTRSGRRSTAREESTRARASRPSANTSGHAPDRLSASEHRQASLELGSGQTRVRTVRSMSAPPARRTPPEELSESESGTRQSGLPVQLHTHVVWWLVRCVTSDHTYVRSSSCFPTALTHPYGADIFGADLPAASAVVDEVRPLLQQGCAYRP